MGTSLHLLIAEDEPDDVELMVCSLRQAGFDPDYDVVSTLDELRSALERPSWDAIVSDRMMPALDPFAILTEIRERGFDCPFIVVSGQAGEELAVEVMRAGAHDYVMKDRLARLGPVIERELAAKKVRDAEKHAESNLDAVLNYLIDAIESIPDGFTLYDPDDKLVICNERIRVLIPELIDFRVPGTPFSDVVRALAERGLVANVETTAEVDRWVERLIAARRGKDETVRNEELSDGRWLRVYGRRTREGDWISLVSDITAEVTARKEAELSHIRLVDAIESLPASFCLFDHRHQLVLWNGTTQILTPEIAPLLVKRTSWETLMRGIAGGGNVVGAEEIEGRWVGSRVTEFEKTAGRFDIDYSDGRSVHFQTRRVREGGMLVMGIDTTAEKRAQRVLRESETRYKSLIETAMAAFIVYTDAGIVFVNAACVEMFGADSAASMIGVSVFERFHPDDRALVLEQQDFVSKRSQRTRLTEMRHLRLDGSVFFGESTLSLIHWQGEQVFLRIIRDVTAQRESREALSEREERLRTVMENVAEAIITTDRKGNIESFNLAAEKMFGYPAEEVLGRNFSVLMPAPDRSNHGDYLKNYLETGKRKFIGKGPREITVRNKDGQVFAAELSVAEMTIGDDRHFVGVIHDISERKIAQMQLMQSARLASLGEMAAGLAHELNQPLNVIRMAADRLLIEMEDGDNAPHMLKRHLGLISEQTQTASAIIDQMRVFGRGDVDEHTNFDPAQVVRHAANLVRDRLRLADIELVKTIPERCPEVRGHPVRLGQVIVNMLNNSRDAIHERRARSKADEATDADRIEISVTESAEAGQALISVADNGGGMPEHVIQHIFDPFFTTKDVDKGTGLGLSISFGIIKEMGGNISVENVAGGARFKITLPVVNGREP